MVDLLVAAITGRDPALGQGVDVRVNLVMTNRSLFAGHDEPAQLEGYGTIPAELAREMLDQAKDVSLQRLFTHPSTGELMARQVCLVVS